MTALEALNLAAPLADTYEAVERRLLVAIARQLSLNDNHTLNEVSKWQIKQLARHGMLGKNAAQIIAAGTKGIPGDVAGAVEQAIGAALAEDGLTEMWRNEGFAESAKQAVKHYRNQAKDVYNQVNTVMKYKAQSTFVNAVNSVADKWTADLRRKQAEIADKQGFLDILNSNTAAVVSGSAARTRAVRDTIHEMARKGIPAFVDRAGREWSPEAYVNMDIRNTVKNTALEAKFAVMDSLGQDVFEVSSHPGSRPKCRPWQGKLISRSGRTTEITDLHGRKHKVVPLSQTSYGEPDGLFGINCGHRPRGCTEGVFTKSEVEYDDEEDKELYNKVCRQRELERRVRKSRTEAEMLEAAGDTEGAKEVRRKMAEQNKTLRQYCEDNGLKYRSDRVRTYGRVEPDTAHESEKNAKKSNPTHTNFEIINSPEYRAKFDVVSDDKELNDLICQKSRDMLTHRSGTQYEDMYLIDSDSKRVVGAQTHSKAVQEVVYNKSLNEAVKKHKPYSLISIHNHPESKPPSGGDLHSNGARQYKLGVVACHDGSVYLYKTGKKPFTDKLFDNTVDKFIKRGYNELEAYEMALNQFKEDYGISWRKL